VKRRRIASTSDIPENAGREFAVEGQAITLWNVGGRFYATSARCPHEDGPLCAGRLEDGIVTCPVHGWRFDVTNGRGVDPSDRSLRSFRLRIEGDQIWLVL
jgi:nitrite reductase/ring-hydroxylating ferredoxin subunit